MSKRLSVIGILNEVQTLLKIDSTTDIANKNSLTLLRLLNETVADCADHGDWLETFREIEVTASTSVIDYPVRTSAQVHHIYEIGFGNQPAPMEIREIQDIRRLNRISNPGGVPRQFAMIGVETSGPWDGNPKFRVYPQPGATQNNVTFKVAFYENPQLYTASDTAVVPPYPANVLVQGTYARALLEENGGEMTNEYQAAFQIYTLARDEAQKRFGSDTGKDVYFTPGRRR